MIKQILGRGSVYSKKNKYGNRYWYLEVRYLDENDEQHKKYIRGVTRRDAFANGDEFIRQTNEDIERISKNEAFDCRNVSFNEFCADYLEKVCKRTVKDSTYLRYVATFKKNLSPQLGDMLMKDTILSVNLRVSGVESSNKSVDEFSYNSFFHLLE